MVIWSILMEATKPRRIPWRSFRQVRQRQRMPYRKQIQQTEEIQNKVAIVVTQATGSIADSMKHTVKCLARGEKT